MWITSASLTSVILCSVLIDLAIGCPQTFKICCGKQLRDEPLDILCYSEVLIVQNRDEEYWAKIRREIKDMCAARYSRAEIDKFLDQKVAPAFHRLSGELLDENTSTEVDFRGSGYYENYVRETGDFFVARDLGIRIIPQDWKMFSYYVFAMSPQRIPFDPTNYPTHFCVFVKKDGEYEFINDINTRTADDVFKDAKMAYDDDRSNMWPLDES